MILTDDIQIELTRDFQTYTAEVPELPGCVASGSTELEALANIQPLINEWLTAARARGESIKLS